MGIRRFGYLDFGSRESFLSAGRHAALIQGLRDIGYLEGKAFVLEERFADGHADRVDRLAAELVQLKVDLILSTGTPAHLAAQRATGTLPVVVMADADPVGNGLAASLARPAGNITGMSTSAAEVVQKLVELSITAIAKLSRIAVLTNPGNAAHPTMLSSVQAAAKRLGKAVLPVSARNVEEIERGVASMARDRAEVMIILIDGFFFAQRQMIAELAIRHRLASIYAATGYAGAGGLMNYGSNLTDNFRRAAVFVDKILKGAKPGELPFEQPTRFYLEINRRTASALGVKIPQVLLLRADNVIE